MPMVLRRAARHHGDVSRASGLSSIVLAVWLAGPAAAQPSADEMAREHFDSGTVFFQLAAAFASNWNKFVNRFGDPRAKSPKFKLIGAGQMQLEGLEPPGSEPTNQ